MEKKQALSSLQLQLQTAATPDSPLSSGPNTPLWKLIIVASIAAGIQFGWALQQSLLSPYVQLLGIPHAWVSITWLCGPISGLIVQPIVGYYSDNCSSRFGRRTPFIASGAAFVAIAVFLIGYAADIGHMAGDAVDKTPKTRAVAVYVVGFWILDVANNMLQGPCRALLADLCGINHQKTRTAFAFFAFFMAVGSVLGYAAGSYSHLYKVFPFTKTHACDVYCANLKSCFFISIFLLATLTFLALVTVREKAFTPDEQEKPDQGDESEKVTKLKIPFFGELVCAFKDLPKPMWILLLVTCLNWIAWFPFIVYGTDWMGREVYGGTVGQKMYDLGVRTGALGLVFNSVALGFTSLGIVFLVRKIGGVKKLWGCANFLLAVCLVFMVLVTKIAQHHRGFTTTPRGSITPLQPSTNVKAGVLTLFFVLGIPLAVTFSVPFALASNFSSSSGAGQGLSLGVLNLAIVIPQLFVAAVSGHWDSLFGGGNLPSFVVGAIAAAASGIFALTILPSPPEIADKMVGAAGGFH